MVKILKSLGSEKMLTWLQCGDQGPGRGPGKVAKNQIIQGLAGFHFK